MEEKEIYKGAIFTLCQKEVEINHLKCQRDIIHHPGGVGRNTCRKVRIW